MSEVTLIADSIADPRRQSAAAWAAASLGVDSVELEVVSGDASFRRYFRIHTGDGSLILMDAPPDKEDSAPFVDIAERLRSAGLNAPEIGQFDLRRGFGLLSDFGDTLYRELITEESIDDLMPGLFDILAGMASDVDMEGLPDYNAELLQTELDLFTEWYLARHKKRPLSRAEKACWTALCEGLIASARSQPQVFVHRDFHSCNLLQTADGPGIIDFQDAVRGPLSYDFISLAWDRYIAWPRQRLEKWMSKTHALLDTACSPKDWTRRCDLMGLQRNLKIVGIFARLHYRDGKDGYLQMIPRFYQYLLDVLPLYPEFSEFQKLLEQAECAP
jgi:aminoglycoside/choline kinase family phosphotransferase